MYSIRWWPRVKGSQSVVPSQRGNSTYSRWMAACSGAAAAAASSSACLAGHGLVRTHVSPTPARMRAQAKPVPGSDPTPGMQA